MVAVLWLACHDPFEDNAEAAATLWEYSGADLPSTFVPALTHYLGHANADVRSAAAAALAAGLQVSCLVVHQLSVARDMTCSGISCCSAGHCSMVSNFADL